MRALHALGLAALLVLVSCDGPSGPETGRPAAVTASSVPLDGVVGTTLPTVAVAVEDEDGQGLEGITVHWAVEPGAVDPAESRTDADGVARTSLALSTTAGPHTLTVTAGTLEPVTFDVNARADALAELALIHDGRPMHSLEDTLRLGIQAEDRYGNAAITHNLTWVSLDREVATVAGGLVTSVADGSARILATSRGLADTVTVDVDQVVARLSLRPTSERVLAVTESLQLQAVPIDSNGVAVDTTVAPAWASSDEEVAVVNGEGVVEALVVGTAAITATAGSHTGEASFEIKPGPRPAITAMSPDIARPGETLTITGTDFAPDAADNAVTVAGVPADILAASATELTVELGPGEYPCAATGPASITVSADGLEATAHHPLAAAPQRTLAVGESLQLHGPDVRCNELTRDGRYVVSVFNASTTATALSAFSLRGTSGTEVVTGEAVAGEVVDGLRSDDGPRRTIRVDGGPPRLRHRPEREAHGRILERNLRLGEELTSRASKTGPARRLVSADPVPEMGERMDIRIPDIDVSNPCASYEEVSARVVYAGSRSIILEDVDAPLAGRMSETWEAVGQEFDALMYPLVLDYFGDPLVLDGTLDDNDRVLMLFSEAVNDFDRPIAGFVFSGDFYPRDQCAASNEAEIFYGQVPTVDGTGFDDQTAEAWFRSMRSTVIHEVKHITSFAHRVQADASTWEDQWLEEATARLAEELYAREIFGYGQHDNTGYRQSLYCEVRPAGYPECAGSPWVMGDHFLGLLEYYESIEDLSPIGPVASGDWTFYSSGWLLVRWAIDQSRQSEATFLRALVEEPDRAGVDNLAARTGRSFADMLADFSLAIAVDDHPDATPDRAALSFPSWDTRDIYEGLAEDFEEYPPVPLDPRDLTFGDFDLKVSQLRGGSASIIELSGTLSTSQLLELLSYEGDTAPANLGVAIMRVQ